MKTVYFFDYDSTIITKESLDELLLYALNDADNKERDLETGYFRNRIEALTNKGMSGEMALKDTISQRLELGEITAEHVRAVANILTGHLTPGIPELIKNIKNKPAEIWIVSGGFHELILPTAHKLDILSNHIFANEFIYQEGRVTGFNEKGMACQDHAKVLFVKNYKKNNPAAKTILIGDGMSDAETQNVADIFVGFGQNIIRKKVRDASPLFAQDTHTLVNILQSLGVL